MSTFPNITLAILAGGKSSRFGGSNKALLQIDGETFIQKVYKTLSPIFGETIVISNEKTNFQLNNISTFADVIREIGPLGGIHSALLNSSYSAVFIVSCDMPFVDSSLAVELSDWFLNCKHDILIPSIGVYIEPLFGLYSKSVINEIELLSSKNCKRSVIDLLAVSKTFFYELKEDERTKRCFVNINSMEDYNFLQTLL